MEVERALNCLSPMVRLESRCVTKEVMTGVYRWHWLIKNNRDADDYSGLIRLLTTMGLSGQAYKDLSKKSLMLING